MSSLWRIAGIVTLLGVLFVTQVAAAEDAPASQPLQVLFLGDNGHHRPAERFAQLAPVLEPRGIQLEYTDDVSDLNPQRLAAFDGLIVYANIERISPEQEKALLDYVASGKGFIPIHCASYCFLNSPAYVELVGAQFQRHGAQEFSTEIAEPDHPIMKGFGGFRSWDETYIHHRHNEQQRTVLEFRAEGEQAEGRDREPWSWTRTYRQGRVFYTAWGHDHRTWGNPGFQNLIERGIRWACDADPAVVPAYAERDRFVPPQMTPLPTDVQPFEYIDVGPKIPNYTVGAQWGTQGEPFTKMQLPLPPEEAIKHYVTPVGFEMQLFAADPELGGKPIAMNWDERGRLWVCETYDYPNELQPPGQGRDRIRICEDTDGDGRADKFTVFAEKLSIPTAIICYRGGVIVQDGTETLFFKDVDGDDRADVRQVLISNWSMGDTHGGVSNFQYGLDNWIWAMQGYNYSEPVINGERQQGFRMGFFRFKLDQSDPPKVTEIEFIRSTDNNTWGLGFSEEGLVFGSTANRNPSVFMPIANRYYEQVRGWAPEQLRTIADTHRFQPITEKIRQVDQHGGYTAGAGHALYTARTYPQQWWNRTAFVCGPTGHLVGTFVLTPNGAGFQSTSPCNLVASDDEWAAPIMAEVGPDGNVWVLDWYNYIVQHNPTPHGFETGKGNAYETDLRDKKHGRIYRVAYAGEPSGNTAAPQALSGAQPQELVAALKHPTMLWRKHAQRLLIERGETDVVSELCALVRDPSMDAIELNVGAIHALWTLHGLGVLDGSHSEALATVAEALTHPSAGVRRNALLVLPQAEASTRLVLEKGLLKDADPQVRLAALLTLADMPTSVEAGQVLAKLAADAAVTSDRWLQDAYTSAAAQHATPYLESLAGAGIESPRAELLNVLQIVAEHVSRGAPSAEESDRLIATLDAMPGELADALITGLAEGWPREHQVQISAPSEQVVVAALEKLSPGAKSQLIRLARFWGSQELEKYAAEIVATLMESLEDENLPAAERIAAAQQLVQFRPDDDELVATLLDLVTPQLVPETARGIIEALGASTATSVGEELVARSGSMTPNARQAAIRVLLSRPQTTTALLEGIQSGEVMLNELSLDQKQALGSHPDREVRRLARELLRAGGGLPDPDREKVLHELLPLAEQTGDVAQGKAVFTKLCAKCHRYQGEGETIGPDLTGMAVHPKAELLTQVLDPSRSVEANFRTYTVVTVDGRVLTGMLAGESRTSIEVIDAEGKRHTIQREDVEELIASRKSLMPEGFEKQMTEQEIVDLLEFLTNKGRFVPLSLDKVATAVSTKGLFHPGDNGPDRLIFPDWGPKVFADVPFLLTDPRGSSQPNIIMLRGPQGSLPPQMPRSVTLTCNTPAVAIHLLSGISGWGYPAYQRQSESVIVRLHYADGSTEDHPLINGVHFADYIRRVDVPGSEFAFQLRGQQLRYLTVRPQRQETIQEIEFVKGDDPTAPIIVAVTVERPQ